MLRPVILLACAALTALSALTVDAPPAAAASLVEVHPPNGATLDQAPDVVVLTFSAPVDPDAASATVTPPGGEVGEAAVEIDGRQLVVDVPAAGDGDYVVEYSVRPVASNGDRDRVDGGVGFTVDPEAEEPVGGGTPWAVASALAVAGLAAALLVTYRRVQGSR